MEIVAFTLAGLCTILTLLILAPLLYAGFRLFAAPLLRLPRARPRSLVGASDRRGALAAALLALALGSVPLRLWLTDTPAAAPSALAWQLAVGLLCVCAAALLLQDAQALRGLRAAWAPAPAPALVGAAPVELDLGIGAGLRVEAGPITHAYREEPPLLRTVRGDPRGAWRALRWAVLRDLAVLSLCLGLLAGR